MKLDSLQHYRFWLKQRGLSVPSLMSLKSYENSQKRHSLAFLGSKQAVETAEDSAPAPVSFPTPWVARGVRSKGSAKFLTLVFPEIKNPAVSVLRQEEKNLLLNIADAINLNISDLTREPLALLSDEAGFIKPLVLKNYLLKTTQDEESNVDYKVLCFAGKSLTFSLINILDQDQLLVKHPKFSEVQNLFTFNNNTSLAFLHSLGEMLSNKDLKRPVWDMLKAILMT